MVLQDLTTAYSTVLHALLFIHTLVLALWSPLVDPIG